jgi:hypothetical protein
VPDTGEVLVGAGRSSCEHERKEVGWWQMASLLTAVLYE